MLNVEGLTQDICKAFSDILPVAFETALLCTFPENSKSGQDIAKQFGETATELIAEPLSERLAAAIDYYIKSGAIKGTIVTVGSPSTQTAVISPINLGNPTAGAAPNTLGIV